MTSVLAISTGLVAAIIVLVAVVLFAVAFFVVSLRSYQRQQEAVAESRARAAGMPAPSRKAPAVSRRDFFRKSLISSLLVFGAQFGGASVAFLWPNLKLNVYRCPPILSIGPVWTVGPERSRVFLVYFFSPGED